MTLAKNKCWHTQQTSPHAPMQGAATRHILRHDPTAIAHLF